MRAWPITPVSVRKADTLNVVTNDPVSPTTTVALSGTGLAGPVLVVTDSDATPTDLAQSFPPGRGRWRGRTYLDPHRPVLQRGHPIAGHAPGVVVDAAGRTVIAAQPLSKAA